MTSYRLMTVTLGLWASSAAAQYVATTQAGTGYPTLTNPQPVVLVAPGGSDAGIERDRGRANVAIPFSFQFYGRQYTTATVTANGLVFFEATTSATDDFPSNVALPSTVEPNALIAPFWDDLEGNNGTSALRQQVVSGPNGQGLAIEWKDWNRRFGMYVLNFQVRLWENGVIEFYYGTMQGAGQTISATIGIESPSGSNGTNALSSATLADGGLVFPCVNSVTLTESYAHCGLEVATPRIASSFDPLRTGSPTNYVRFGPPPGVDLQPTRLRVTGIAQAGNDLQISAEVSMRNFGTVPSAPFHYRLYLSEDSVFDRSTDAGAGDPEIVTGPLAPGPFILQPNAAQTQPASGVAPRPTSGSFYVLAVVDSDLEVSETNEVNNVLTTTTPYFAGVDLVAESAAGPPSAGPGDPITISYSLTNQGFDPAGAVPFKLYFSPDTVFSADDLEVYSGSRAVAGGENVSAQVTFSLDPTIRADLYYVLLRVDDGPNAGAVVEVSDANNQAFSRARVQVRQADLVVDRVRVARPVVPYETATAAFFGEPIRVEATIRNQGGASAPNVTLRFFMSDNESLNGLFDPPVCDQGPFALAPGASRDLAMTCLVPTRAVDNTLLTRGTYFFFGAAVASGLAEIDPANNWTSADPVRVRGPAPNLVPVNLRGPSRVGAGEVFAVTRSIRNIGNRPSPAVKYRYVVSANAIITLDDLVLPIVTSTGEVNDQTVTLALDQQNTATELVRVPAMLPAATYYLGLLIDPDNLVDEVDKTDNGLAGSQVQVVGTSLGVEPSFLPDGIVGQPYVGDVGVVGTTETATFTVKNLAEFPPGLTLQPSGRLTGTPTRTGAYAFTLIARTPTRSIEARRGVKVSKTTASLTLVTRQLPPAARLVPYDFQLGVQGGLAPYRFAVSAGLLPEGLALTEGGRVLGMPSGALGTTSSFTLTVVDAVGNRDARVFEVVSVDASPFRIVNVSLPHAVYGQQYLVDISAQNFGGAPVSRPVQWRVLEGGLPPGLALEQTVTERVILSGTPTGTGVFRFRLQVVDAQGREDSATYTVLVGGFGIQILGDLTRSVGRGDEVNVQLNPSSTVELGQFLLLDGSLPPGLTLSDAGLVSGQIDADAPYRGYTFNVGYGPSHEYVAAIRTFRIDVETLSARQPSRCDVSASSVMGLAAIALLRRARKKRD